MSANTGKSMHWLLRTILISLGIAFVLCGGAFAAACISLMAKGANAGAAANVPMGVQIGAAVFFALVAIAGAFMIWLGARRGARATAAANQVVRKTVATAPARPATSTFTAATTESDDDEEEWAAAVGAWREASADGQATTVLEAPRPRVREARPTGGEFGSLDSDLGQFIARCGPELNGLTYNYVSAGVYFSLAIACIIAPHFMELAIDKGLAVMTSFIPAAFCLGAVLLHLWTPFFGTKQTIELYEFGIVERLGEQERRIESATIEHLRVQEWFEHRFADRTYNVKARIQGQPNLEFSTALRGQGDEIVDYLASSILGDRVEFVEFVA